MNERDIVEQLRDEDEDAAWCGEGGLFQRAATEIERLRARVAELEAERDASLTVLDDIGRTAMACWMDMQGRATEDEHKRAHGVLGSIVKAAAAALPSPPAEGGA